jgi:GNAT superfamily N-acetyltransferase
MDEADMQAVAENRKTTPATDREDLTTWTGLRLAVRPVTPRDEPLLAELFANLTPEDRRFRFLTSVNVVGHEVLERLTNVDHDRTEDFLAFDGGRLVAAATFAADQGKQRAEVAISVHPDYKRRGVGWALLGYVTQQAKAKGIGLIESVESRDNIEAIKLEEEMGFQSASLPGDSTLVLLSKKLN